LIVIVIVILRNSVTYICKDYVLCHIVAGPCAVSEYFVNA